MRRAAVPVRAAVGNTAGDPPIRIAFYPEANQSLPNHAECMSRKIKLLAVVLMIGGLFWLALTVGKQQEEAFREHLAEQARAEKASVEKMGLKSRAFKLGDDRGREAYREDSELPSEAVLKEAARPIAIEFEIQPEQLEDFLHQYALGYGWGWDNVKTQRMSVSPVESP